MIRARAFLKDLRLEHTLFALPFAYVGAIMAARGLPSWTALAWITLAVFGARTAAMAANRYFDRDIDARNPRTARRALASGALDPSTMLWAAAIGLALLLVAAWELNPLCVKLMPLAALGVLLYPLCKRFTWLVHFVLGAVDGLAPLGAFIGIAGKTSGEAWLLFVAVTVWVAGFDIIYALMDVDIDRREGLRSLPARFGERSGRLLPLALHVVMIAALFVAGYATHAAWPYDVGIAAACVLVVYEERLFGWAKNVFALNERVFAANMTFSVVFLATTAASFTLGY
ncbi:MAG: putative 4-hydroxybenzoate polyprenyltransferase [Candidatus Eremiobacteraeota bacterium]|nr:putative 4-hydroxybenzoate polyprenyltransferase [Candidatus Eremiobacteraeota bacterium]